DDFHLRVSEAMERNAEVHGRTLWAFMQEVVRENAPGVQMLSGVQRRLLLEEVVAELRAAGELQHFGRVAETRGCIGGLVELIAELKRNEVRPVDFARACDARGYAGEDFAERIGTRRISRKERETARLYAEYQRRLARLNLCDADDTAALARELLRA